jgi:uncharacterized membrane protein
MSVNRTLALAAGLGALAGLRTFTPPSVLSQAAHRNLLPLRRTPLRFLRSAASANTLAALAAGELVGDKLPFTPSRLAPAGLTARFASGALCGAALMGAHRNRDRNALLAGAAVGAAAAIAGAFAGYHLRRQLGQRLNVPDPAVAVVEDMIAVAGSIALVRQSASLRSYVSAGLL